MSAHLLPCPSCKRHVRVSSDACPFCTFLLSDAFRSTPARLLPTRRLGRAATFAFGAALAGATACGSRGHTPPAPEGDQSGSVGEIYGGPPSPPPAPVATPTPTPDPGQVVAPAYGGPPPAQPTTPVEPPPSGGAESDTKVHPIRHRHDPDTGNAVALYGVPFSPDHIDRSGGSGLAAPSAPPALGRPDSPRDPK